MRQLTTYQESVFEKATRLLSLFILAPILLALSLPVAVNISQKPDYGLTVHSLAVVAVATDGPAARAGVVPGDHVVAVAGTPTTRMHEFYAAKAGKSPSQSIVFSLRNADGNLRHVSIMPFRLAQSDLIHNYSEWVVGLSFLMIGWWVFWQRSDPVARNFFFLCLIFTFFLMDIPDHSNLNYMLAKDYLRTLLQLLLPAFFLRFFLQFPSPLHSAGGEPAKYRLLLVPGWVLFALVAGLENTDWAQPGSPVETGLAAVSMVYIAGYFLSGLVIFGRRVLRRDRPIQHTKLKVVLLGLVGGIVPFLAATIIASFLPGSPLPHWQYLSLSPLLIPISCGLAIMRYGALDTGFIVRIGLVYGLLTVLVLLGYFLMIGLVGNILASVFDANSWPVMVFIAAISGLAILPLRKLIQEWIDKTFYPARKADRRAINRLAEHLTGLIDPEEVVQAIQENLCSLYRPREFALFLPSTAPEPGFRSRLRSGCPATGETFTTTTGEEFLAARSALAHLLNHLRRPVFREELEDNIFAGQGDSESLQILTRLEIALVVPLITGNRLLGFMAFGAKRSGELFSQDDLANLRVLAIQAASLVESRQLYQASLQRKRLETELEVARDIQAKLLPAAALSADTFAISGRNEPCRMVGGDYFDYFTLDNGNLCFTIADVSGKGIPAALMMTSVRVAFRQEAVVGASPRDVIAKLNEVVMALGSQGHFICFFYGMWDPITGLLTFCNAGMEPPVLFRPRDRYQQVLKKGGPVLGVEKSSSYREGTIVLAPGDRVFLYTDGLTEERNAEGEFFDTDRLLKLVDNHAEDTPDALLGKVFARVNAFGGEERSDDRTAIILEIKRLGK